MISTITDIRPYDFPIEKAGKISALFLAKGIHTFEEACAFVRQLRYGRNSDKEDITTLFSDNCGTCSTKHALLKQLADEQQKTAFRLMLGIFRMNEQNAPRVGKTLYKYNLPYLPEAHNYLKYHNHVIDCTLPAEKALAFESELITEIEIKPTQITHFKVSYHKAFLQTWLLHRPELAFGLEDVWNIREECIEALSN